MPKTIQIQAFAFGELSEGAKERAINKWLASESPDLENALDDAAVTCKALGVTLSTKPVRLYGGGYRNESVIHYLIGDRGEGVAIDGDYAYNKNWKRNLDALGYAGPRGEALLRIGAALQTAQKPYFYQLSARLEGRGRDGTVQHVQVNNDRTGEEMDHAALESALADISHWICSTLRREYDYYTSAEYAAEMLMLNEYQFDVAGNML